MITVLKGTNVKGYLSKNTTTNNWSYLNKNKYEIKQLKVGRAQNRWKLAGKSVTQTIRLEKLVNNAKANGEVTKREKEEIEVEKNNALGKLNNAQGEIKSMKATTESEKKAKAQMQLQLNEEKQKISEMMKEFESLKAKSIKNKARQQVKAKYNTLVALNKFVENSQKGSTTGLKANIFRKVGSSTNIAFNNFKKLNNVNTKKLNKMEEMLNEQIKRVTNQISSNKASAQKEFNAAIVSKNANIEQVKKAHTVLQKELNNSKKALEAQENLTQKGSNTANRLRINLERLAIQKKAVNAKVQEFGQKSKNNNKQLTALRINLKKLELETQQAIQAKGVSNENRF